MGISGVGCTEDGQCGPGLICELNRCRELLTTVRNSNITSRATVVTGTHFITNKAGVSVYMASLGDECSRNTQCETKYCHPKNRKCSLPPTSYNLPAVANGKKCNWDSDCISGYCQGGGKVGAATGVCGARVTEGRLCQKHNQCQSLLCDPMTKRCSTTLTANNGLCDDSRHCLSGSCVNNVCVECHKDWQCYQNTTGTIRTSSQLCINNSCVSAAELCNQATRNSCIGGYWCGADGILSQIKCPGNDCVESNGYPIPAGVCRGKDLCLDRTIFYNNPACP